MDAPGAMALLVVNKIHGNPNHPEGNSELRHVADLAKP